MIKEPWSFSPSPQQLMLKEGKTVMIFQGWVAFSRMPTRHTLTGNCILLRCFGKSLKGHLTRSHYPSAPALFLPSLCFFQFCHFVEVQCTFFLIHTQIIDRTLLILAPRKTPLPSTFVRCLSDGPHHIMYPKDCHLSKH